MNVNKSWESGDHEPRAMRNTLMTRMIVGLMGMNPVSISSRTIPAMDSITIAKSNWFHLTKQYIHVSLSAPVVRRV